MSGPYRDIAAPSRPCPRCGFALGVRPVLDARLDECPSCEGLFVDKGLVPRILDPLDLGGEVLAAFPARRPAIAMPGPMYVKCPRCQVVMNRRQFASGARVVVDVCREHGVWFDADELRAVAAFAEGGGMERAAAHDARRREQDRAAAARDLAAQRQASATHARHWTEPYQSVLDFFLDIFR